MVDYLDTETMPPDLTDFEKRTLIKQSRYYQLKDKRTGPFVIHAKLNNGAYKLATIEGKVLQKYFNSDRLTKYYEKQNWKPMVMIEI